MIRKFGTVDVPVEVVRWIFSDIESWPQWMPTVRAVRILERSQTRALVEVDRVHRRRIQKTTFEFHFDPHGYRERQVAGMAKKWESAWRFQAGPRNIGTLISCRLELDMGFIGLFAPSRMIQRWIDRTFEATLQGLRDQAHLAGSKSTDGEIVQPEARPSRIQVFATPTALEIWVGDRKYVAHVAD